MSGYFPPEYYFTNIAFNSLYYSNSNTSNLTYDQASKSFLKFPNSQGTENLLDTNVNGTAIFNSRSVFNGDVSFNGVTTLTTNPVSNDNSQRLATTSWTQSLLSSTPNNAILYPQKWISSLMRNVLDTTGPIWSEQSVDIVLPFSSTIGTGNLNTYTIILRIFTTCVGRQTQSNGTTDIANFNFLLCDTTAIVQLNLRQNPATLLITNGGNTSGNVFQNVRIQYNLDFGASDNYDVVPCALTTVSDRNKIRLTFRSLTNASVANTRTQRINSIVRSVEILTCNLNGYTNINNNNNWNVATIPNQSTTSTQNLPAYIVPVSTNSY